MAPRKKSGHHHPDSGGRSEPEAPQGVDSLPPDNEQRGNDKQLLGELAKTHWHQLYRFILRHIGQRDEAEDLTQRAFEEAVRSYAHFRGESGLSTWLYGIAMNLVRNYFARAPARRFEFSDDHDLDDICSERPGPEEELTQAEQARQLAEALAELPGHMRDILLLVGLEELSYEDAAVLLACPVGTIRSRLSRARTALKDKLRNQGIVDFQL